MWVIFDMFIILLENASKELVFGMMNSFDDKPIITREIKKGSGFSRATELGEYIFRRE